MTAAATRKLAKHVVKVGSFGRRDANVWVWLPLAGRRALEVSGQPALQALRI